MGGCVCKSTKTENTPSDVVKIQSFSITSRAILTKIVDVYQFHRVIGHGHFGVVREASKISSENEAKVAIKTISKDQIGQGNLDQLRRELDLLAELDHPNIIKLHEIYEDAKYIHIVTEICYGGDLFDWILQHNMMNEVKAAEIMKKMLRATNHMHNAKVVHRDIKPANILLVDKTRNSDIRVIDLGLANKFKPNEADTMQSQVGSPYYMAPEVIGKKYGKECDVWSLGILLYFMLSGHPPFEGENKVQVYQAIQKYAVQFPADEWHRVSAEAKDLITQMLKKSPAQRITIQDALKHPWFELTSRGGETKPPSKNLKSAIESLRAYQAPKRIESEWMRILVKYLPDKDVEPLRQLFNALDKSNDGYITADNLASALSDLGQNVAASEIQEIISKVGAYGDQRIFYSQFLSATFAFKEHMTDQILFQTFQHFDTDKKGFVTKDDLSKAVVRDSAVSQEQIDKMVAEYHFTNESHIEFEEFKDMMMFRTDSPTHKMTVCPIRFEHLMETAIFHGEQGDICLIAPQIVPTGEVDADESGRPTPI